MKQRFIRIAAFFVCERCPSGSKPEFLYPCLSQEAVLLVVNSFVGILLYVYERQNVIQPSFSSI